MFLKELEQARLLKFAPAITSLQRNEVETE